MTIGVHVSLVVLIGLPIIYMCYYEKKKNEALINLKSNEAIGMQGLCSYICCALFLLTYQNVEDVSGFLLY